MYIFMLFVDLSYALLDKYYMCRLLQLQHSSYLLGFSYHTCSKFNFLMSIIFALLQLFDFIELIVPIVVLKI